MSDLRRAPRRRWGIDWDDGTKSDYTLQDMQNYCVSNKDGAQVAPPLVTAIEPEPETTEPDNESQLKAAPPLRARRTLLHETTALPLLGPAAELARGRCGRL